VEDLAGRLARSGKAVLMGHRGWYDPQGAVPELLAELDRLLGGEGSSGIIYLGRDCNSRRASLVRRGESGEGERSLLLLFGADPLGTALPSSELRSLVEHAKTTVVFDTFMTKTAQAADALFPLPSFAEKEGTFRSCNGLDQHLTRAIDPPPGVPRLWETLDDIAAELGRSVSFAPSGEGEAHAAPPATGAPGKIAAAASAPTGGRTILLRGIPIADHRLRLVDESAALFPGKRLEVNPGDLEGLGAGEGDRVRITSGGATIELTLRADLKTPPGQAHLPFDPEDAALMSFALSAERPEGWPADHLRLAGLERASGPAGEGAG
jgi:anaerobic selenocysteine-containing dehydrogenase